MGRGSCHRGIPLGSTIKNDHVYCWKSIAQNLANAAFGGSGLEMLRYWAKAVLSGAKCPLYARACWKNPRSDVYYWI
jgi:hypothetical protein